MSELSDSDAELAFVWLPEHLRADVEYDAWDDAIDATPEDDMELLEAADDDPDSAFSWDRIDVEKRDRDRDQWDLVPLRGADPNDEPEVYDAAGEFGWAFVEAIRERVRELQEATNFSPREFVALVLSRSRLTWAEAASVMGIAEGTFSSKMQREVSPEIDRAEETLALAGQLDSDA